MTGFDSSAEQERQAAKDLALPLPWEELVQMRCHGVAPSATPEE